MTTVQADSTVLVHYLIYLSDGSVAEKLTTFLSKTTVFKVTIDLYLGKITYYK